MDRWMGGWVDGWMGGWVDGWMGGWVDGWMGGWVDGWMGGWVDGCTMHGQHIQYIPFIYDGIKQVKDKICQRCLVEWWLLSIKGRVPMGVHQKYSIGSLGILHNKQPNKRMHETDEMRSVRSTLTKLFVSAEQ